MNTRPKLKLTKEPMWQLAELVEAPVSRLRQLLDLVVALYDRVLPASRPFASEEDLRAYRREKARVDARTYMNLR